MRDEGDGGGDIIFEKLPCFLTANKLTSRWPQQADNKKR